MDKAVKVEVTAIDTEYGFTHVNLTPVNEDMSVACLAFSCEHTYAMDRRTGTKVEIRKWSKGSWEVVTTWWEPEL